MGLYSQLRTSKNSLLQQLQEPQEVFDYEIFKEEPAFFYSVARVLFPPKEPQPSLTHRFLAFLEASNKLQRVVTQNIDGLEERAGVTKVRRGTTGEGLGVGVEAAASYPVPAV